MSIENHVWQFDPAFSFIMPDGSKKIDFELYGGVDNFSIGAKDVEALAIHFGLLPKSKTPKEIAEIERTVASSLRLNNGG